MLSAKERQALDNHITGHFGEDRFRPTAPGPRPQSTNYFVVHKSGRRIKVTLLGYKHTRAQMAAMVEGIAKAERHVARHYAIVKDSPTIRAIDDCESLADLLHEYAERRTV